ncbi:histidine kinase [Alsobacter sp. R-9]
MPVIIRFVLVVGILAGCAYAGLFALATFYEPEQREITITIPASKLGK